MRLLVFTCLFVLQLWHYGSEAALTTLPQSDAIITGRSFQLNCAADSATAALSFQWQYNALQSTPIRIVYNCQVNPDFADRYEVVRNDDGECNLVVLNADIASAGTYSCQNGFEQASAVIVMLNSNSACSATPSSNLISGDIIRIRCFLNYNGSSSPRMLWFDNSTGYPLTNSTTNTFPTQVNSYIDVPVYAPTARPFTCNTFFDSPITWTYSWTLPTVFVQYFVTNVLATARVNYFQDTSLVCSADGYPAPLFTWTNLDTGATFAGETVSISGEGISRYECSATNAIRGQTQTVRSVIAVDITQGVPEYCPTTTAEPTTEPTTTTTTTTPEPTTVTTTEPPTTTAEPIGECGRLLNIAPSDAVNLPSGWSRMCYVARTETALLTTPCRNLLVDLPPGYPTYNDLIQAGGNFGCSFTTRDDYLQATSACFDNYQHTSTLSACSSCQKMFVCVRLP